MAKNRKFDSRTKISILERHLKKKEAISTLCDEHNVTPGAIYQWQDALFSRGHTVFEAKAGRPADLGRRDKEIAELRAKLASKDNVISELTEVLVREKKLNGAT
jgi:transposase